MREERFLRNGFLILFFLTLSLLVRASPSTIFAPFFEQNDQHDQVIGRGRFGLKCTSSEDKTPNQELGHAHEVHCSRERSRAARKIVEEYLMPFVERERYQLSHNCKLHPDLDLFKDQEEHKVHVDVNEWRCGYCKKSFRAEKFLDQHFDNRHYDLLNVNGSKCLADLCGALHCDLIIESINPKTKCKPAAAARNCHLCESLANSCFPVNQGRQQIDYMLFLHQFCDAHTCSGGAKPFSRGRKKHVSIFYLACSILVLMMLPIFYLIAYLYQSEMKKGAQAFKRISKQGRKPKPS